MEMKVGEADFPRWRMARAGKISHPQFAQNRLLAFLLIANPERAERSFVSGLRASSRLRADVSPGLADRSQGFNH
jgi:hypothetical protein